ncbi:MAG TPA: hypothetical protein PKL08_14880 [Thermoanaerobaculaceae bacterium]|nr:hypothetical protein [Thermoanaerobaculaceae bacterium]
MATRSVLLCFAVLAAGCSSTAAPAAPAAPSTASTAPTTTAAPATTVERPWEQEYRARLDAAYAADTPAAHIEFCTQTKLVTDDELKAQFSIGLGTDSKIDKLMAERGETPTAEDYDRAMDIAVEKARENCA